MNLYTCAVEAPGLAGFERIFLRTQCVAVFASTPVDAEEVGEPFGGCLPVHDRAASKARKLQGDLRNRSEQVNEED